MKKRIGVVLSGCGVFDGSEIHEAVFTLLAIDRNGAEAVCMAPDMELDEVNHLAGQLGREYQPLHGEYPGIGRQHLLTSNLWRCFREQSSHLSTTLTQPQRLSPLPAGNFPAASGRWSGSPLRKRAKRGKL